MWILLYCIHLSKSIYAPWAGEMPQQLRAHAAFAEDWSLIPSIHSGQLTEACNSSLAGGMIPLTSIGTFIHVCAHVQVYVFTHVYMYGDQRKLLGVFFLISSTLLLLFFETRSLLT